MAMTACLIAIQPDVELQYGSLLPFHSYASFVLCQNTQQLGAALGKKEYNTVVLAECAKRGVITCFPLYLLDKHGNWASRHMRYPP